MFGSARTGIQEGADEPWMVARTGFYQQPPRTLNAYEMTGGTLDLTDVTALAQPNGHKILLLVLDGLGGLPLESGGLTELETARTPNMDALLASGDAGLHVPVATGVTPGSGPGHLSLFGFDPLRYRIGRGVLEALGIEFPLEPGDVAIRGNLCTVDSEGRVVDRRAGRIPARKRPCRSWTCWTGLKSLGADLSPPGEGGIRSSCSLGRRPPPRRTLRIRIRA